MADDVGKGVVSIEPDTSGLGSKIAKGVNGESGIITKAFHGIGSLGAKAFKAAAVGAAVGFAAAVAGAKVSIDAASDLAESVGKVNVVFGDSAGEVKAWAKDSATAFGQSNQAALEAAGTYGNLFQAFGIGQKPAQEMSTTLVELAADLASFNNTSTDEALDALRSGLSGETEPLKKYGVAINDVRLKEQALAMGLISSTKDALTPAAKAQASYALILQDTTLAQGDFARTSDGLANKQRILGAQMKNLAATIGAALIPMFLGVVGLITGQVIPTVAKLWEFFRGGLSGEFTNEGSGVFLFVNRLGMRLGELVDWVKANWPQIRSIIGTVLEAVGKALAYVADIVLKGLTIAIRETVDFVRKHWDTIRDVFVRAAEIIADTITGIIDVVGSIVTFLADNEAVFFGIATIIGGILVAKIVAWTVATWAQVTALWAQAAAFAAAHAPVIAIIAVLALLVAGVIYAYQNWGWFRDAVDAVATFMRDTLWPILQSVFGWMMENIPPIIAAIAGWITGSFIPALQSIYSWVADNVFPIVVKLAEFFVAYWTLAFQLAKTAVETVITVAITLWGWLQTLWDRSEGLRGFLASAFKLAWEVVSTAVGLVISAISGAWDWLQTMWDRAEPFRAFLAGAFALAIGTVSGAFIAIKNALLGVWEWVKTVWDRTEGIRAFFAGIFLTAVNGIKDGVNLLGDAFGGVVDAIQWVIDKANAAMAPIRALIDLANKLPSLTALDAGGSSKSIEQILEEQGGRARGGPVFRNTTYLVGEKGPEYLTMGSSAGYITPNHRLGSVDFDEPAQRYTGPPVNIEQVLVQSPTDVDLVVGELNYMMAAI